MTSEAVPRPDQEELPTQRRPGRWGRSTDPTRVGVIMSRALSGPARTEPVAEPAPGHPADVRALGGAPSWQTGLVRAIALSDLTSAGVAALLALLVWDGPVPLGGLEAGGLPVGAVLVAAVVFPLLWVAAAFLTRSYEPRFLGTGSEEYRRVFDAGVRGVAGTALVALAVQAESLRVYVLLAFPATVVLTLCGRYGIRQVLHRRRAEGRCLHKVVVVGRERSCAELIRQLRRESYAGFSVVGACVDRSRGPVIEGVPVIGTSTTIVEALRRTGADTVAVGAWSDLTQSDLRRLSWQLEGSRVALVVAPSLTDVAGPRIHIRPVAGLPLLHVEEPEFTGGRRLLKGAVDRTAATLALLLLSPLLLAIGLAVRLTSRGPALFRQTRVGVDGSSFTMYKFRSMQVDAEAQLAQLDQLNENDGLLFKMRDDPRVTPLGKVLRRFSVDELPQLINVALGSMSLVGPRPPLPTEVARYGDDVRRRLLVRPGVTGLWQISGRSELSWDESVRLDLHYVENWSLALDILIIWKTLFAVVKRDGAY